MKKLLLIIVVLFGLQGYGQKTFEVYNFTLHSVVIHELVTSASGAYPMFSANFGTIGPINIPPGGSYTLVNTASPTRFPFQSPSSIPNIPSWTRWTSSTTSTSMISSAAWVLGNPQVFERMTFRVIHNTGVVTGGTISTASPTATGPVWDAVYDMSVNPSNPNEINYTIVFF